MEVPNQDTIVALDTEFVALKQPEIEMNSEGEMETIRPMTHALARVSVVRGQGVDEGLPFIDDYIMIAEPVVDYLTLYSGITRGDLDPRTSQHTLVPLKRAFKRLWVLLNLGCKFLGHGLKQDFRVINIQVPKAQIIDTIDLFFLKNRLRRLSLAFLAWCVLKENIQLETHDSIEDARTALKLYRKFLEFDDAGILEPTLQDIYREGRETNFKPPKARDDASGRSGTDTPPVGVPGSEGSPLQFRSRAAAAAAAGVATPPPGIPSISEAAPAATAATTRDMPISPVVFSGAPPSLQPPSLPSSYASHAGHPQMPPMPQPPPMMGHSMSPGGPPPGSRSMFTNGMRYQPPAPPRSLPQSLPYRINPAGHSSPGPAHANGGHSAYGGPPPFRSYRRG